MGTDFYTDQLTDLKALASEYLTAITTVITSGGKKSYSLDTGQTVTRVTLQNVDEFQNAYRDLLALISTLEARCNGAAVQSRPAW